MTDRSPGSGPLADRDIVTGGPIDDPATTDRNNPAWAPDPTAPAPDVQPLTNPDGSTDVLPPETSPEPRSEAPDAQGTPQDQAAQPLAGQLDVGRDNIREGRGDTLANPALAEGGDNG